MNEESVMYIINYFNQYPDQPPEVLVKNVISSGYNMTDLKEALRRMGISPIVIPGYKEPVQPSNKPLFPKMPLIIAGVAGLLVISGLSTWVFMNSQKKEAKKENAGTIQQGVITQTTATPSVILQPTDLDQIPSTKTSLNPIQSISESPANINPISKMESSFSLKNYKVKNRQYEILDPSNYLEPDENNVNNNFEVNGTQYYKQGQLVRSDYISMGKPGISIEENQRKMTLNPENKTYSIFHISDNFAVAQQLSFYYDLKELTIRNKITWENTALNEWTVEWMSPSEDNQNLPQTLIILDSDTHFITKKLSKYNSVPKWVVTEYKYELIDDIDSLLKIPEGYTLTAEN